MLTPAIRAMSLFLLRVMALSLLSMVMVSAETVWDSHLVVLGVDLDIDGVSEICQMPSMVARFWSAPRKAFLK